MIARRQKFRAPVLGAIMLLVSIPAQAAVSRNAGVDVSMIRVAAAFILCCFVALAVALVLRRRGTSAPLHWRTLLHQFERRPQRHIEIVETRRMSMQGDVCLLRWNDHDFLVACGPGGMLLLDQKPSHCGIASPETLDVPQ